MNRFHKVELNRERSIIYDGALIICRLLLFPILIWYRLYLWVYDGEMFNKRSC